MSQVNFFHTQKDKCYLHFTFRLHLLFLLVVMRPEPRVACWLAVHPTAHRHTFSPFLPPLVIFILEQGCLQWPCTLSAAREGLAHWLSSFHVVDYWDCRLSWHLNCYKMPRMAGEVTKSGKNSSRLQHCSSKLSEIQLLGKPLPSFSFQWHCINMHTYTYECPHALKNAHMHTIVRSQRPL